jgi:hypothetical protein
MLNLEIIPGLVKIFALEAQTKSFGVKLRLRLALHSGYDCSLCISNVILCLRVPRTDQRNGIVAKNLRPWMSNLILARPNLMPSFYHLFQVAACALLLDEAIFRRLMMTIQLSVRSSGCHKQSPL